MHNIDANDSDALLKRSLKIRIFLSTVLAIAISSLMAAYFNGVLQKETSRPSQSTTGQVEDPVEQMPRVLLVPTLVLNGATDAIRRLGTDCKSTSDSGPSYRLGCLGKP